MSEYSRLLGRRLRSIRQQQGLSLHGVEQRSRGRWKAVVVGSYERGDRAVTVSRLWELAEFYGVPVAELLPGATPQVAGEIPGRVVLDLARVSGLPAPEAGPLVRFVRMVQARRGDYNGRVLTVRHDDLHTLALLYDEPVAAVVDRLAGWRVLDAPAHEPHLARPATG